MKTVSAAELTDQGICPTCYDLAHGRCVFGDPRERILHENARFSCLLITNPRAPGHAIILTKEHYKDMVELPDDLCREVYGFAKKVMCAIKEVYGAESVYLCTMCDGPMNHFHLQMIPRYCHERRGSRNYVKERQEYIHDAEKVEKLRNMLNI